jgi:hypothetical protein
MLTIINIFTVVLVLLSLYVFLKYNDEWLLIIIAFFVSSGLNRYNIVVEGKSPWVRVAYAKGVDFFKMTDELGLEALGWFLWGTLAISVSYFFFKISDKQSINTKKEDTPELLSEFLALKQQQIIIMFFIFIVLNAIAKSYLITVYQSGASAVSFSISYLLYFGMALGGMILLMYMSFQTIKLTRAFFSKIFFFVLIVYSAISSYDPNTRFQFLSWSIALGIIVVKDMSPIKKLRYYLLGGTLLLLVFSAAGVSRMEKLSELSIGQIIEKSIDRAGKGEDSNMLDGLMMVLQVYPQHLNYQFGMQHFEVLLRPIPRSLWAGKPLGGYANKLGLNDNMSGATVGISESIYGTFYGEGGFVGIFIFCVIYGYMFFKLFKIAGKYDSDVKYLIKGIILASTVPLLRGGDLPGIIAFVCMTYWPVFLFIYQYNKYIETNQRRKKRIDKRINKQAELFQQNSLSTNNV